jgi:hypothetical protein
MVTFRCNIMSTGLSEATISRIIGVVPIEKGFHFYKKEGAYTGVSAFSLTEFENKLRTVDASSVEFHFKRKDFQKWIEDTLGDVELAERLNRIKIGLNEEGLREEILKIVQKRLAELQKTPQGIKIKI